MTLIKKANIAQLLVLSLAISSCAKEIKKVELTDAQLPKNVLPIVKPAPQDSTTLPVDYISAKKAKIEAFYEKNWPNGTMNGSFLVAQNGQIIFEKYNGYTHIRDEKKITPDTPLHIASVSKVLTATVVLKLVNAKRLDLDQKVNTILQSFPYPEVTVRMLLNHRSGMRNYAYFTDRKYNIWDRKKTLTNQDVLDLMATKNVGLEARTGTRFAYCNTNYAMLALIIEKITKLSYIEAMDKMLFQPLGMTHSFVCDIKKDKKRIVPSYKANKVEIGIDYLDGVYGDKNIYSTPRDLLKFDLARNAKNFLEPGLWEQVFKPYSNERKGTKNYGLGIRMINWETGQNFYFHNGWWHGNTSSYITLPKEKVVIIALSNKMTKNTYAVRKLAKLFGDYPFKLEDEE